MKVVNKQDPEDNQIHIAHRAHFHYTPGMHYFG